MRVVTAKTVAAFEQGKALKVGNTYTNGKELFLFDNMIAKWEDGCLWITNAGYETNTTKERLNGLNGVSIYQRNHVWYLNGEEWNGSWTKIEDQKAPAIDEEQVANQWNLSTKWVSNGYRGRNEATCGVAWAPDTGMWSDSPYRSDVTDRELKLIMAELRANGIQSKVVNCETSNVFCQHRYVVTKPKDMDKAKAIVAKYLAKEDFYNAQVNE